MRPYFIFNGTSSKDMPVIVQKLPVISSPSERVETITIPGRDGTYTSSQDDFDSYSATAEMLLTDMDRRDEVVDWLKGSGNLIVSDFLDFGVKARISKGIPLSWFAFGIKKFIVEFEIQPFLYESDPEDIVLTTSGDIVNPGTRFALPVITVEGTGTFMIGSNAFIVTETGVVINSEIEECYKVSGGILVSKNDKVSGGFPKIQTGTVAFTLGAGITKLTIKSNWRWH